MKKVKAELERKRYEQIEEYYKQQNLNNGLADKDDEYE